MDPSRNARPQMGGTERTGMTMPRKILPRITAVSADEKPLTLRIRWERGDESRIDLSGPIETFRVYEPLRHSRDLFRRVHVGEHGTDIVWSDEIDMAADTLWRLGGSRGNRRASPCRRPRSSIGASVTLSRSTRRRRRLASAAAWSLITNRERSPFRALSRLRRAASTCFDNNRVAPPAKVIAASSECIKLRFRPMRSIRSLRP